MVPSRPRAEKRSRSLYFVLLMSSLSDTDLDLWDTISCSKCLLPFLSKAGPTIPFWLTECGHILCNNHLSKQMATCHPFLRLTVPGPNQSCTQCGAQGIQLTPLQKEVATSSRLPSTLKRSCHGLHRWKPRCPSGFVRSRRPWMLLLIPSRFYCNVPMCPFNN